MSPRLELKITRDKSVAIIKAVDESGAEIDASFSQDGLMDVIKALGRLHANMMDGKPVPDLKGEKVQGIYNARWHVQPHPMGEASALIFFHPAFGALGFIVPVDQVKKMIAILNNQVSFIEKMQRGRGN